MNCNAGQVEKNLDGVRLYNNMCHEGSSAYQLSRGVGFSLLMKQVSPKIWSNKIHTESILEGLISESKNSIRQPHFRSTQNENINKDAIFRKLLPEFSCGILIRKVIDSRDDLNVGVLRLDLRGSFVQHVLASAGDDETSRRSCGKRLGNAEANSSRGSSDKYSMASLRKLTSGG